ncbi:MAG TPA: hypothetical protein VNQ76_07620 [Planctomicrobium sp.]|nr:hypothetical protein [Planctomicrobium sp.]
MTGFSEVFIVGSAVVACLALLVFGRLRLRKKLTAGTSPTAATHFNPFVTYAVLGGLLIGVVLLLFHDRLMPPNEKAETALDSNLQWEECVIADGTLSIEVPSHWRQARSRMPRFIEFSAFDFQNDLHLSVYSTPRDDLAENTLTEVSREIIQNMQRELSGEFFMSGPDEIQLAGFPAEKTVITGGFHKTSLAVDLYVIQGATQWNEIRFRTPRSRPEGSQELFARIVSSIRQK